MQDQQCKGHRNMGCNLSFLCLSSMQCRQGKSRFKGEHRLHISRQLQHLYSRPWPLPGRVEDWPHHSSSNNRTSSVLHSNYSSKIPLDHHSPSRWHHLICQGCHQWEHRCKGWCLEASSHSNPGRRSPQAISNNTKHNHHNSGHKLLAATNKGLLLPQR